MQNDKAQKMDCKRRRDFSAGKTSRDEIGELLDIVPVWRTISYYQKPISLITELINRRTILWSKEFPIRHSRCMMQKCPVKFSQSYHPIKTLALYILSLASHMVELMQYLLARNFTSIILSGRDVLRGIRDQPNRENRNEWREEERGLDSALLPYLPRRGELCYLELHER